MTRHYRVVGAVVGTCVGIGVARLCLGVVVVVLVEEDVCSVNDESDGRVVRDCVRDCDGVWVAVETVDGSEC
eukprot:m.1109564 g.1109564  ORF g.1109564 m.1109564 type:complete len:72 (+) comp24353_c0_seq14:257-472(+)